MGQDVFTVQTTAEQTDSTQTDATSALQREPIDVQFLLWQKYLIQKICGIYDITLQELGVIR